MNNKTLKICIAIIMILLVVISILLVALFFTLDSRFASINSKFIGQTNDIMRLESNISRGISDIEKQIEDSQSLFVSTEIDVVLGDGNLVVTAKAMPKTIKDGDKVYLTLKTSKGKHKQLLDENFKAEVSVDFCNTISPILTIVSGDTEEYEILDEINTKSYLTQEFVTEWEMNGEDNRELEITLDYDFCQSVKSVELIEIKNSDITEYMETHGDKETHYSYFYYLASDDALECYDVLTSLGRIITCHGKYIVNDPMVYVGQVDSVMEMDEEYHYYVIVTTQYGKYVSYESATQSKNSWSAGSCDLYPIFDE